MKKIFKVLMTASVVAMATGCSESYLDVKMEQQVATGNAVRDLPSLNTAVNGVYNDLQSSSYYGRSFMLIPEIMSDNAFVSQNNAGRYLDYDAFIVDENDGYAKGTWDILYHVIANANIIIEQASTLEFNDELKDEANQLIGEAHALRALAYFDLSRFFSQPYNFTADASHPGVILVTSNLSGEILNPERSSVKAIYEQIESDLEQAIAKMTVNSDQGRLSVLATKGIKAKVHLYKEEWDKARKLATEVISDGAYVLLTNAEYAGSWASAYSSESMFSVANTLVDNPGSNALGYFYAQVGYGDGLSSQDLFDLFDPADVRLDLMEQGVRTGAEDPAFFVNKYAQAATKEDNIPVLRLSEMYLIRAEANAELGGADEAAAQADLETIIKRAWPTAPDVVETGQALKDKILEERRKELNFEGNRLFDLNRKKKDINMIRSTESFVETYPNDKFILPIPIAEINANTSLTASDQNPGY